MTLFRRLAAALRGGAGFGFAPSPPPPYRPVPPARRPVRRLAADPRAAELERLWRAYLQTSDRPSWHGFLAGLAASADALAEDLAARRAELAKRHACRYLPP